MNRLITSLAVVCIISTLAHTKVAFADLKDGLVAYYPFNSNANDESGNGNNGTVYGATLTADRFGNTNKAYSFDGVDDYIETSLSSNTQPLSISVWFNPTSVTGERSIVDSDISSQYGQSIIIGYWDGDGTVDVQYHNGDYDSSYNVNVDSWCHAVAIFTSGKVQLYINGVYIGSETFTQEALDGDNFRFGRHNASDSQWFSGLIDNIRIYSRTLSESEIQELYNEGSSTTPTPTATPTATLVQTPTPTPTVTATVTPTPTPSETGIVFGYIYDEDENPLRGVTVKIDGDDYSDSGTTDEDGYYEFDKVPDGDYTITYTKTGYVTQTAEATVTDGDKVELDTVTMQVAQKGSVYGYVTNIRGDPIGSVRLTLNGIGTKVKKTASTDSDGFFEFKDLEAGTYRIVAKKRFYKAAQQTVELEEGEDKEIEIEMKKTTKRIKLEGVLD